MAGGATGEGEVLAATTQAFARPYLCPHRPPISVRDALDPAETFAFRQSRLRFGQCVVSGDAMSWSSAATIAPTTKPNSTPNRWPDDVTFGDLQTHGLHHLRAQGRRRAARMGRHGRSDVPVNWDADFAGLPAIECRTGASWKRSLSVPRISSTSADSDSGAPGIYRRGNRTLRELRCVRLDCPFGRRYGSHR